MRALLQRVLHARVSVAGETVGSIGPGYLILLGITHTDTIAEVNLIAQKTANLRVFDDADGNLNRSALDLLADDRDAMAMLVVSQFTLYADTRKGRRPSFSNAAPAPISAPLVDAFVSALRQLGFRVETGQFGAEMVVELANDGPVTIWLDSDEIRPLPSLDRP